jgi:glutamate:GABA antiporter
METTSHGLRRELKLRNLVMMQVVLIIGLGWTGFAAKQGSSQLLLWLIAILLFYLPLAAVVMKLSRAMPMEGGVYQWTRAGISPFAGYMAGWCVTTYAVVIFASIGSQLANGFAWAAGPGGAAMGTSKWFALLLTATFCLIAWFVNVRGLHLVKRLSDSCAVLWVAIVLILLYLLVRALFMGGPAARGAMSFTWPEFSLLTVGVLAKMSIGALSGFDNSSVFAEECRHPGNDVARSVLIAAPAIAVMYVLTTASLLVYTPPANIDLAAPIQQGIHAGFGNGTLGKALTMIVVGVFSYALIASGVILIGMVSRLPMVAGWDGLLPGWWSELHPTWRTPLKAIGSVCAAIMLMAVLSLWGAANQEAVQALTAVAMAALCVMYMLLFGVILFGFRSTPQPPGPAIRLGALAAFVVALVSFVLQIVALGEVNDTAVFAAKVVAGILLTNGLGAYLYWNGARKLRETSLASAVAGDGPPLAR